VSGRRWLALVAAAGAIALIVFVVARRAVVGPSSSGRRAPAPAGAPASSGTSPPAAWNTPPPAATTPDVAAGPLTPEGAARALEAINGNAQMRRLFMRLQPIGMTRAQKDRVLLILGAQALRPAEESPTLEALRADGRSRALSEEEAKRVRDERQKIDERTLLALRPALAAVLTPEQLARAGLGDDSAAAGEQQRK